MSQEIERKFLVKGDLSFIRGKVDSTSALIEQTYLASTKNEEVRLRSLCTGETKTYWLTVKSGNDLIRKEFEAPISEELYDNMISLSSLKPLVKERISIMEDGYKIEVDIYKDFNFVIAEVEFETELEAESYNIPEWFGEEQTYNKLYKNKNLWESIQYI